MACPGPPRVQVLDEAWAFLKTRHTAGFLQSCFKLGRSYGTANICLSHRVSDLAAQADDGTATAKIGKGLIADSATKIILRQAPDQIATTVEHAGLTEPQADTVARLGRGCALWKVGATPPSWTTSSAPVRSSSPTPTTGCGRSARPVSMRPNRRTLTLR